MPQGSLKLRKPPGSGGKKNGVNRGRAGKKMRKGRRISLLLGSASSLCGGPDNAL